MKSWQHGILAALMLAMFVGGPFWYLRNNKKQHRNFRTVDEGTLYRCGQISLESLQNKQMEYNIRTVVSLRFNRQDGGVPPDAAEEAWCKNRGINYVRIRPRGYTSEDAAAPPGEDGLRQFIEVMADKKNHPVLLHCLAGIHRTGVYTAIYRMEFNGWTNADAIEEMRRHGYENIENEADIRDYLRNYSPRLKQTPEKR